MPEARHVTVRHTLIDSVKRRHGERRLPSRCDRGIVCCRVTWDLRPRLIHVVAPRLGNGCSRVTWDARPRVHFREHAIHERCKWRAPLVWSLQAIDPLPPSVSNAKQLTSETTLNTIPPHNQSLTLHTRGLEFANPLLRRLDPSWSTKRSDHKA